MTLARLAPLLLCLACSGDKDTGSDTSDPSDTGQVERPDPVDQCDPEVKVDGTPVSEMPDPSPGDSWYVLLYCDGTLQMGTYVLQADPPELVTIDSEEPILTFKAAGSVELEYRMGSKSTTFVVNITD